MADSEHNIYKIKKIKTGSVSCTLNPNTYKLTLDIAVFFNYNNKFHRCLGT